MKMKRKEGRLGKGQKEKQKRIILVEFIRTDIKTFEIQDPSASIDDTPFGNGERISYVYQGARNYTDIKGYYTSSNLGINTEDDYGRNISIIMIN